MKRYLLLLTISLSLLVTASYAGSKDKGPSDEIMRKSAMFEPNPFLYNTSYPLNFAETSNPITAPAISTGYYFVDSKDEALDYWRPIPEIYRLDDTTLSWVRIVSGPRQIDQSYWTSSINKNGLFFFRNPAVPTDGSSFFVNPTDSTDDAIAGPMPLNIGFYFNGLRMDSFYVSTNGLICLTNRRYYYDDDGNRYIPAGSTTGRYDKESIDWFVTGYGRSHIGDGSGDNTPDDYGYQYAVLNNSPMSTTAGIRDRNSGTSLSSLPYGAHVIAPFWGDNHLSQWHEEGRRKDDWGKVFFTRVADEKVVIYFQNVAPVRTKAIPNSPYSYNAPFNLRPGEKDYVSANAQVILDRMDSSVTILYEVLEGRGAGAEASVIFRWNTTTGVRGFARHVNYDNGGCVGGQFFPWCGEYEQFTHYFAKYQVVNKDYPKDFLAIKFKQWKNTLRVVDIQYRVRKQDPNASLDFTEVVESDKVNNYELLAGEDRIGALQPVAILQNLTNGIQGINGVNFQKQNMTFRARFRILNEATGRIVYNRLVPVDSTCMALPDSLSFNCTGDPNVKVKYSTVTKKGAAYTAKESPFPGSSRLNGVPPYGFVQVFFPPFEPNEFVSNHIGRLRAFVISDPTKPSTGEGYGDEWPFDDTTNVRIFSMRRLEEFKDDVTRFHRISKTPMPSTLKWVNIDAEVAQGEEVSNYPLAPRGAYKATNNEDFNFPKEIQDLSGSPMNSPVILMNRVTLDNDEPATSPGGDEIRSFPIDLRNRYNAVLSLSIQRSTKTDSWDRGWSDATIIGCEPRTFVNGDLLSIFGYRYSSYSNSYGYAVSNQPDEIRVELMKPSPDRVQFITNVEDKKWREHPRRGGLKPITTVPAYALYGSNGHFVGFLESDKDSSLEYEDYTNYLFNGLRPNMFEDGIDYEYQKAFIAIPDTFIKARNEGAKNFRFRIRVMAYNHKKCLTCIPDDKDPFYVDNVRILFPSEITDIEISTVKILWPYTVAPASQATAIPISVKLSNNTTVNAPSFWVKVKILPGKRQNPLTASPLDAVYCRTEQIPFLLPNKETEYIMPSWDARKTGPGDYTMIANLIVPGGDLEPLNDTTYTFVKLTFGDVFAYDPVQSPMNDVPTFLGYPGRGLNLYGFSVGAAGRIYGPSANYSDDPWAAGYIGGSGSGQIAMKFVLVNADTIYGFQAFFGTLNQALDDIALSIYDDQGGTQPGQLKAGSLIYRQRGLDDIVGEPLFDRFVTYLLPSPVVLQAGTYWACIAQMGETGLELGASKARMGMRTTNVYIPPPVANGGMTGGSGVHLMIEKNFRKSSAVGGNLINNNLFCYENTRGSGTWNQFMPTVGNPAYAHLHHFGISPIDYATATCSRGGWIPMFRPFLGNRKFGTNPEPDPCDDDVPVELVDFNGIVRNSGIELNWETASEINNAGFYVERRISSENTDWNTMGFVEGGRNSNVRKSYNYFDGDVTLNTTYDYRLRQVDLDGTQSCPSKEIVTVTFDQVGQLTLDQNVPNPFANNTRIAFNLPDKRNVKLEVLDIYGNVISTLINGELSAKRHEASWTGVDQYGNQVANGTYIYRLTAGNEVLSSKMTLIR